MTSISGDLAGEGGSAARGGLTEADRALLLSMLVWAKECKRPQRAGKEAEGDHDFILRFWDWLEGGWVHRLCEAWDRQAQAGGSGEAARALVRLREMHVASARAELGHVHASWLVRALREESPAVQRLVAACVPESVRHRIQAGLLLDAQDIVADRPVHPEFQEWVLGLWTERLVGGEAVRPDDPPALIALSQLSLRACYGLCRMAGLGKMALAEEKPGKKRGPQKQRERAEWLHDRLAASDSEFQSLARNDVKSVGSTKLPRRHHAARIGLFTFARLLADFEPFRLRWALQHWPYAIVKLTRSLMSDSSKRSPGVLRGEALLLKTAWERLTLEGRLANPWPEQGGGENGSRRT
jgi:hypothetical protein